jgi:alkylated DNA repair dioxygenase AlkB
MTEVTTAKLDAPIMFIPGFLDPETADQTFATLLAELPWERRTTEMYGKDVLVPRMEVWVTNTYLASKAMNHAAQALFPGIQAIVRATSKSDT